jgi:regulator of nucleoside diphosphate kinase
MASPDPARPPIRLSLADAERLMALGLQAALSSPRDVNLLLGEVERAELLGEAGELSEVVALGCVVEFTDAGGPPVRGQIVYSVDADLADGQISVLSNVGAGLIGLCAGQTILWPDAHGRQRPLTVLKVQPPTACPMPDERAIAAFGG